MSNDETEDTEHDHEDGETSVLSCVWGNRRRLQPEYDRWAITIFRLKGNIEGALWNLSKEIN